MTLRKFLLNAIGFGLVGVGIAGVILPGLPGFVFLVYSLFIFRLAGNERLEHWLLNHRWFGKKLQQWDADKSLTVRTKAVIVSVITIFSVATILRYGLWVQLLIGALGVAGVVYILTRPTRREQPETPAAMSISA